MSLSHIFHLSDLHIRNGDLAYSRFDEYNLVFNNTLLSIENSIFKLNLSSHNFIILITGDIFHNKSVVGNYGLALFKAFIQSLSKIGRLFIISGNHDYDQSDPNKPSLVFSSTFDIPNVSVLNTSTSFIIDDIGFSFVSIDKTLDNFRNSGRITELPPFPTISEKVKYKIALFHGSFASAKLFNGKSIEETFNPYPLEWVKDFDFVLLGDIHKRQVFKYKKKTICGYSGSLIQQNYGEDIIEHGYLLWNLDTKIIEEINVYNNIGYINVIEDENNTILIRTNGKYTEPLETYIKNNINYFPKNLEIKSFTNINYQSLSIILNSFNISFQIVSRINTNQLSNTTTKHPHSTNEDSNIDNLLNTNYLLDYFKKLLSSEEYNILLKIIKDNETLLFDIHKYPEDLHQECIKRNKELIPIINSCNTNVELTTFKKSFLIKYLEWGGLLCYENKNWVNFKDLDAKTFMIRGSNGTGKSAIYDILLLAIWATNNKLDTYSAGFINHNKDKGYTIVDIEIDNITYRIKRDFCKKKNTFKIVNKSSVLYNFDTTNTLVILKKDSACNAEIKTLFGDIETFLSTSMITQNIDNDILTLNYKDTLATIDKAHNIQYIYHLYNLFKTAINKYKDFRKVINNKKEVYEKLLFNGANSDVNDAVISKLSEELFDLNSENEAYLKTFNSINIDISNPSLLSIIDTDYITLIDTIDSSFIVSEDIYKEYLNKLNHYKYSINDECLKDMKRLVKSYTLQLEDDFNKLPSLNKPCDFTFLSSEENALRNYIKDNNADTEDDLIIQKEYLARTKKTLSDLITNKPNKVSTYSPNRNIDKLSSIILKIYNSLELFNNFIASNTKPSIIDASISKKLRAAISKPLTFENYNTAVKSKELLDSEVNNIKNTLVSLDKDFNALFSKQQQIIIKSIPSIITYKQFKTTQSIAKELKHYNIDVIDKQISEDEIVLNNYHKRIEEINMLDIEIDTYNKELALLNTNDDYKYNPDCCICCSRTWVSRIKELEIIIDCLANKRSVNYDVKDYNLVSERFEENKKKQANYHLLNEWYYYFKFKETYDKITNDMNSIINTKNTLKEEHINKTLELTSITEYIEYFILYSFQLFDELNNIRLFDNYSSWENNYNETNALIDKLEKGIHYNLVIKPRITKYIALKKEYEEWLLYDKNKKIIDAYHYYEFKKLVEMNDLYNEYQSNAQLKPLIKQKIELNELIANKKIDIKTINDRLVKYTTINSYNNENKKNYTMLSEIDKELETTIDVIDTILVNFQSFRKELYDTFVLNKLVDKTNKIIKTLCHSNTKPFKLNYNVDISNDNVHIYWLIHNDNIANDCDKQYISVSQASGFQRFVISLALRMTLYFNNYDVLCNQLFIDEGFINFDKYNLSIVPSFLKSLLRYFNTIVILSHIDIIQDTIDETATINFNIMNSVSSITYN
jgi:hypothetical protein